MDTLASSCLQPNNNLSLPRIGFHYFPDTLHYREKDLQYWLTILKDLCASWLVLPSSADRAIPEYFIRTLQDAKIEPIIQFNLSLASFPELTELDPLISAYAHWGIRWIIWYDRPNSKSSWPSPSWAQNDIVERYLDRLIPLIQLESQYDLARILPPLEPGGSYWDTAFLRATLESLIRRKQFNFLEDIALSAYAWTFNHPIYWGYGGPSFWPDAHPYHNDPNQQDQRGFHIYDWYNAIVESILGKTVPILLLGLGVPSDPLNDSLSYPSQEDQAQISLAIARLLADEPATEPGQPDITLAPMPENILAGCFWALCAGSEHPARILAWFQEDGKESLSSQALKGWINQPHPDKPEQITADYPFRKDFYEPKSMPPERHPIRHYLLLPTYEWGIADWHLNIIRPFVNKYKPTIGYSITEASLASRVTVIGDEQVFPEDTLQNLRQNGTTVERICGNGTNIASLLSER